MKILNFFPYYLWPSVLISYLLKILGKDSFFQRFDNWLYCRDRIKNWLKSGKFTNKNIVVKDPEANTQFILRKMSSDINVFEQVIINKEYHPVIDLCQKIKLKPNNILDLGANIGLTSVFFALNFPQSKIIALEPDIKNFSRITKNLHLNDLKNQIKALQGAVWFRNSLLTTSFEFRDGQSWSIQVKEAKGGEPNSIRGYSVFDIMEMENISQIDILKIDIEGAEKYLFQDESSAAFLKNTKVVCIEIHEEEISRSEVKEILEFYQFKCFDSGEHLIGHKMG